MKDKIIGVIVITLFSPFIIAILVFALPILLGDYVYSRYRKEPRPEIPKTVNIKDILDEEIATRCLEFIATHLIDVKYKAEKTKNGFTLISDIPYSKTITLNFNGNFSIDIADLNTYEWYIDDNHRDIDLYLWIVVGVLRGGVQKTKSQLGRVNYWIWCQELGVWVVMQKQGTTYDGIHFYANPPEFAKKQFVNEN